MDEDTGISSVADADVETSPGADGVDSQLAELVVVLEERRRAVMRARGGLCGLSSLLAGRSSDRSKLLMSTAWRSVRRRRGRLADVSLLTHVFSRHSRSFSTLEMSSGSSVCLRFVPPASTASTYELLKPHRQHDTTLNATFQVQSTK